MKRLEHLGPHLLFIVLVVLIWTPGKVEIENKWVFLGVVCCIEILLLIKRKKKGAHDIVFLVFAFLIIWEFVTTKMENQNTMLYPIPERVFAIYASDFNKITEGIFSSLKLLFIGFGSALSLGISLGLVVGWFDRLRTALFPIAKVISPIPPIVYAPYAVALLPSFRAASIFVIFSSIFWSVFMNMIISIANIDRKILDSAKTLNIKSFSMIVHILLPYSLPTIIRGLAVSVSSSFMVLTAAEMIGATSGLGWFVKYYSDFADYTRVVAGIIMIGVVVTGINFLIAKVEKRIIRWN